MIEGFVVVQSPRHVILYVDCNPDSYAKGVCFVRGHARSVIASTEPQSALRILAIEPVSLVVISDGFNAQARTMLVREMKTIKAHVPVVLLAKEKDALRSAVSYDAVVPWGAKEQFVEVLQRLA